MNDRGTWMLTHIYACGNLSPLIMCTISIPLRNKCMNVLQSQLCGLYLRVTTQQSLPMVRLGPVRPTLWRDSSTQQVTLNGVSSLVQWRRYSASSRCNLPRIQPSWSERLTSKSTMKWFQTFSRSIVPAYRSVRTRRKVSSLKAWVSGLSAHPMNSTAWRKRAPSVVLLRQPRWTTWVVARMPCS